MRITIILLITFLIVIIAKKGIDMSKEISNAFSKALKSFEKGIVQNAERIFRLETANFTSFQFLGTYSPGMEAVSLTYPYGWFSLATSIWKTHPEYKPSGIISFNENTGLLGNGKGKKNFIKFPSFEAALFTVCTILKNRGNIPGAYFSTDTTKIAQYNDAISKINATITNTVA